DYRYVLFGNLRELADILQAHSTGRDGIFQSRDDRDRIEYILATRNSVIDGAALRTNTHSRNDTLRVAALIDISLAREYGGSDRKACYDNVGVFHAALRRLNQFVMQIHFLLRCIHSSAFYHAKYLYATCGFALAERSTSSIAQFR